MAASSKPVESEFVLPRFVPGAHARGPSIRPIGNFKIMVLPYDWKAIGVDVVGLMDDRPWLRGGW